MSCPNDCQKQVNSIFICLVLILLFIFFTGCHSVKFEWLPQKDPKETSIGHEFRDRKDLGGINVDVLKITRK